jgi:hypothetical protein
MPIVKKVITSQPTEAAYKEYSALVEKYKIQNPVKYQAKKAYFDKKLEALAPKKEKLEK